MGARNMNRETSAPAPDPAERIIPHDQLERKIYERLLMTVRARNTRLLLLFTIILTGFGISFAAVSAFILTAYLDRNADFIETRQDIDNEWIVDTIRFNSEIAALNFRVLNFDRSRSFTTEEGEEIISQIESLVPRASEQELRELGFTVETVVEIFIDNDRLDLAMQINEIAFDLLRNSSSAVRALVQACSFSLLGDAEAPVSWKREGSTSKEIYDSCLVYADIAKNAGYRELYLPYEMLLGYVDNRPLTYIEKLIDDADTLSPADAALFNLRLVELVNESTVNESTAKSKQVAERTTEFLCEYGNGSNLLGEAMRNAALDCAGNAAAAL